MYNSKGQSSEPQSQQIGFSENIDSAAFSMRFGSEKRLFSVNISLKLLLYFIVLIASYSLFFGMVESLKAAAVGQNTDLAIAHICIVFLILFLVTKLSSNPLLTLVCYIFSACYFFHLFSHLQESPASLLAPLSAMTQQGIILALSNMPGDASMWVIIVIFLLIFSRGLRDISITLLAICVIIYLAYGPETLRGHLDSATDIFQSEGPTENPSTKQSLPKEQPNPSS